jgi:hypothetical protein
MTWNEQDHPREENGQFTFKNGGKTSSNKENPKDILYQKSRKQKEIKTIKQKRKNELLDVLKDKATPVDILYGDEKSLSKKIKELGLDGKMTGGASGVDKKLNGNEASTKGLQAVIGENYGKLQHGIAKSVSGKDTAGMLDLAHGDKMNDKSYIKDAIKLKNFNDPAVASDKEYLKAKISKQFKDYGFKTDDIKGYFFKKDSEPSKRVSENKDFHQILKDNKEAILNGKDFSGRFPAHFPMGVLANSNLKNAIGAADFKHPYFDKQGNLHIKMYDTYDFNKNATDVLNIAGRREMKKGNLKPYFSIHDIIISKDKLDEIWK